MHLLEALLLVLATLAGERVINVPRDVRRNDEMLRNRDEDLCTWIEDDNDWLKQEMQAVEQAAADQYRYLVPNRQQQLKDAVRRRYRDQRRDADRAVRAVALSEEIFHHLYRHLARRPMPVMTAEDSMRDTLDIWSQPVETFDQKVARIGHQFGELTSH